MRKSKEFDHILDECLERILVKGETLDECVKGYPQYAAELKPLLQTALTVKKTAAVNPRPEFAARARYQFQLAVREAQARRWHRFFVWRPAWVTVVSVILAFLVTSSVTVAAAGNSMPDEALYPVKVATEQVRLALTPSPVSKAELSAELADRRVVEIVHLAKKAEPVEIELELAVQRLQCHLERIATLSVAKREVAVKKGVAPRAPMERDNRTALAPAPARAPVEAGERSFVVPTPKSPAEPGAGEPSVRVQLKKERLKRTVAYYAARHPEALREALRKAPESAKPMLRRAIIISEEGYQQARQCLD